MIMDERKHLLLNRLLTKSAQSKRPLLIRLIIHPLTTLYPKILMRARMVHRVGASTFWGGKMDVILPEGVSTHIWRYGFFEEDVCTFILQYVQQGMSVFDVGAHYGFFSLLASSIVGKTGQVLSLEPTPSTFSVLKANVSSHNNVRVLNCAVSDRCDEIDFWDFGMVQSAYNSVFGMKTKHQDQYANQASLVRVKAVSIDSVVESEAVEVNCVKIDAESSEMAILSGMRNTIERYHPIIILELGDFQVSGSHRSSELVYWLSNRGYIPYEFSRGEVKSHSRRDNYSYCNLLFLPD